jgi:hypothetical protein
VGVGEGKPNVCRKLKVHAVTNEQEVRALMNDSACAHASTRAPAHSLTLLTSGTSSNHYPSAMPAHLALGQQHITAVEKIVQTSQNIVATVNLDCWLNLKMIMLHIPECRVQS